MPPAVASDLLPAWLAEAAPVLLRRVLAAGGRYADVFAEHTVRHRISWRQELRGDRLAPAMQQARRHVLAGGAVRVFGPNLIGFAVADGLARPALTTAADEAAGQIDAAPGPPPALPAASFITAGDLPEDAPDRIRPSEKRALVEAAADAAFALDARVRRVEIGYHDVVRRTFVAASDGVIARQTSALVGLRVAVTLAAGEGPVEAHAVAGGPHGFGFFFETTPEQVAREAVARAGRLAEARPLRAGVMPVVTAGGWGGLWLHEAVGHLLEADAFAASPLAGRFGGSLASAAVTLVDDPTVPGGRVSFAVDDEGVAAQRTVLIERGVLRGLLADRRHARALALPRTGNGRRQDYRHPPRPRMTNLLLMPGDADPEALLADVRDGLFVEAVGRGVVQPDGAFSVEVLEGRRIECGRLTAPVAGVRLAGTAPELLAALDGVGADFRLDGARGLCRKAGQTVPVSVGTPTVRFAALRIETV